MRRAAFPPHQAPETPRPRETGGSASPTREPRARQNPLHPAEGFARQAQGEVFEVRLNALEDACQPGFEQGRYAEGISLGLALDLATLFQQKKDHQAGYAKPGQ
jgi:hypothetical protein